MLLSVEYRSKLRIIIAAEQSPPESMIFQFPSSLTDLL